MSDSDWTVHELGSLAEFRSGGTPSKEDPDNWGGSMPWVSARDMKKQFLDESELHLSEKGSTKAKIAPRHSILILVRGMALMKGVPICLATREVAFNQDIKALIAKENIDPLYLSYALLAREDEIQSCVDTAGHGTGRLETERLKTLPINTPPLEEQQNIARVLSAWDRAIETTERLHRTSVALKKAMLNGLVEGRSRLKRFGKAASDGGTPLDWKTVSLGKVGRCITGLTYSPEDVVDEGGLLVLRSSNIAYDEIALDDKVYVTTPVPEESLTKEGDILVAVRNGSRNLIGKNAVIGDSATGMAHGAFMTLYRSDESDYLSHLFQSEMFFRQVNRNLGATINSINISHLNKFRFPFPPKEERSAIASVLSASSLEIATLRRYLAHLRSEKDALMQQLLTGRLRVKRDKGAVPVVVNG